MDRYGDRKPDAEFFKQRNEDHQDDINQVNVDCDGLVALFLAFPVAPG